MRKIALLSIPLMLAASCSVWAQMNGTQPAAKQNAQQAQATRQISQSASTQQVAQQQQAQYQQVQNTQTAQQMQYGQSPQQQYVVPQGAQSVPGVQPVQQTATVTGGSAVPVTTVVPVQQNPVSMVNYTTVIEPSTQRMTRAQRRAYKADQFAARVDSLVRSRSFVFYPNSMQAMPDGPMNNIVADYYYFGLFVDSAEIHLPSFKGSSDYIEILNFDAPVSDYRLYIFQSGLSTTFTLQDNDAKYFVRFVVSTVTGETVLMITSQYTTMRYVGYLSMRKLHED